MIMTNELRDVFASEAQRILFTIPGPEAHQLRPVFEKIINTPAGAEVKLKASPEDVKLLHRYGKRFVNTKLHEDAGGMEFTINGDCGFESESPAYLGNDGVIRPSIQVCTKLM